MITFFEITGMLAAVGLIYLVLIHLYNQRFTGADKRMAIDYLPFPVYFGLDNSLPLVVNDKMYELIYNLKGKPLTDMSKDFSYLYANSLKDEEISEELIKEFGSSFFIKYNKSVYCVEEKIFADENNKFTQINAIDITEEYDNLIKLKQLNEEIKSQNERLKSYIRDSIEINHQQELLDAKISIHGKFGDCLAMSRHILKSHDDAELNKKVCGLWQQIVIGFTSTASTGTVAQKGYEELQRVSQVVGCDIIIHGTLPEGAAKPLMVKFLREALNNAIRHANASSLTVDMLQFYNNGIISVWDNGTATKPFTKMGGGLSSLKEVLEKNGVIMDIDNSEGFKIILHFPDSLR